MGCEWLSVGEGCGDGWPGGAASEQSRMRPGSEVALAAAAGLGAEGKGPGLRHPGTVALWRWHGGPLQQQTELWELDFGKGNVQTTRWSTDVLPREQGAWYQPPLGFHLQTLSLFPVPSPAPSPRAPCTAAAAGSRLSPLPLSPALPAQQVGQL